MSENTITILVTLLIGLFGGGGIYKIYEIRAGKGKSKVETESVHADNYGKLKTLIEDTLQKNAELASENAKKDAVIANDKQQISTLNLMVEVANGTINKNNEFMKEVLIGWGEMKKSEETCQRKLAELEMRMNQFEAQAV